MLDFRGLTTGHSLRLPCCAAGTVGVSRSAQYVLARQWVAATLRRKGPPIHRLRQRPGHSKDANRDTDALA